MTFAVGDTVRLTGSSWGRHGMAGDTVTILSVNADTQRAYFEGSYRPGGRAVRTERFWVADIRDAPTDMRGRWAGELVTAAATVSAEPDRVFHLGMACLQAGVTEVAELERALRLYVLRDRIETAMEHSRQAETLLRGMTR